MVDRSELRSNRKGKGKMTIADELVTELKWLFDIYIALNLFEQLLPTLHTFDDNLLTFSH